MLKLIKFLVILFMGVICCACVNRVAVQELNQKAIKYLNEGETQAAISRLEASVDLDGEIYESRYNLANAYITTHQYEKALEHAEVAITLIKNEPIVYYIHGVAAHNSANNLFVKKDENGEEVPVQFTSYEYEQATAKKYVDLLTKANESYDKYVSLAKNAEDTNNVLNVIKSNKEEIQKKVAQYNLETAQ